MYKHITIIALLFFALLSACAPKDNWVETKSSDSTISLMLPPDMHAIKGLNQYAIMQYGNLDNSISVMVIADSIDLYNKLIDNYLIENPDSVQFAAAKGFDGYCSMVVSQLMAEALKFTVSENRDTVINSMKVRALTYNAKYESDKSYIRLALYEGKASYYQVFAMISASKSDEYDKVMKRIVESMKEQ
ncbi:MAG: hypothetical protein J6Z01_12040 [Bacteroidales bacterium]|nr:hypothetical protein [Bacteroidales bacterium]